MPSTTKLPPSYQRSLLDPAIHLCFWYRFEIEASGNLKQGEFGWEFEELSLSVRITVPTEKDKKKMKKAAERAHRYCVVSNSMKCPVHLSYDVAVV